MLSVLKILRLLRNESLDHVAAEVAVGKGWLSTCERFSERHVGKSLRQRLEAYYSIPWGTLSKKLDNVSLARSLAQQLGRSK
jgi:hypothetical protein